MTKQFILISSTILGTCLTVSPVYSQILTDDTTNTSIQGNCQTSCNITGGTVAGDNLFHSFQEFNVPQTSSAYFADPGVANIFSRVTGSNPSEIFGTLGISGGNANLFLLNPNGIIFGEGATLDLNGSLFATTADEIKFGEHSFGTSPNNLANTALLTVKPSAILFNQLEQNRPIILDGANLALNPQQNITLIGQGDRIPGIELKNSTINVIDGNINLGAVNHNAELELQEDFQLRFLNDVVRGDIFITDGSEIVATNLNSLAGKEIRINSKNLELKGNSTISSFTIGTDTTDNTHGANIDLDAQESVKITGENSDAFQQFIAENFTPGNNPSLSNGLQTNAFGTDNAGDIKIKTPRLLIDNGAGIVSATNSLGKSGNIDLEIADTFTLRGSGVLTGSSLVGSGDVGEISIKTNQLLVQQNSVISSSALGSGDAGNLSIFASELIEISDTLVDAVIPTGIYTNTVFNNGQGGDLNIDTSRLIIQNGGQISASNGAITRDSLILSGGQGGNVELNVADSIEVKGQSADGNFVSSIISDTRSNAPAGNLTINTGSLLVNSNGFISASSIGSGAGGKIEINARNFIEVYGAGINNLQQIIFDGLGGELNQENIRGGIAAFTIGNGEPGSMTLNTAHLNLDRGGIISTATYGDDNAGNLSILATEAINVNGSAIISPTFGAGDGGKLDIKTKNLSITRGGAIASASLSLGKAGDLKILATESISIFDIIPGVLFSGSISTGNYSGQGLSGNLEIDTQRLLIKDGASIEANNISLVPTPILNSTIPQASTDNVQGELRINASESIEIVGNFFETNPFNISNGLSSHISSTTDTANPASNVIINTGKLSVFDRGEINVSSLGDGAAGRLQINAESVTLNNKGNLSGTTSSGQGGDIDLSVTELLRIEDNSIINTNATAEGNGGNIDITANFVIATEQSSISANAKEGGNGGNIDITANDVFLVSDSIITADSTLGIDGTVEVKTLVDTEQSNFTKLPQKVIKADHKITRSCTNKGDRQGTFTYTGKGGLPFNPLNDFRTSDVLLADLDIIVHDVPQSQFFVQNKTLNVRQSRFIEANQWLVNDEGKVELVAHGNHNSMFNTLKCLASS